MIDADTKRREELMIAVITGLCANPNIFDEHFNYNTRTLAMEANSIVDDLVITEREMGFRKVQP